MNFAKKWRTKMKKAILISINPKWVAKILNGEKTLEIRKTFPKCDLPIDVYIYCTKDKKYANLINRGGFLTGMVVAKFTLNKVEEIKFDDKQAQERACLTEEELFDYLFVNTPYHEDMKQGYAWHINNLEIFDKPKELSDFSKLGVNAYYEKHAGTNIGYLEFWNGIYEFKLTTPPQSWCYIEV